MDRNLLQTFTILSYISNYCRYDSFVKIFWVLKDFYLYFCENFEPFDADWAKLADSCSTVRLSRCKRYPTFNMFAMVPFL